MTGRKQEDLSNSKTQLCYDIKTVLGSLTGLLPARRIFLYINPLNGHFDTQLFDFGFKADDIKQFLEKGLRICKASN